MSISRSADIAILEAELSLLKRALAKAEDEKQSAIQNSSYFLSHLSHEIRTPLSIVLGFTDLLTADTQDPKQRERLDAISSNSRHLLDLLNRVLHFSRLEADMQSLDESPLELTYLSTEIQSMFSENLANQGIVFQTLIDPDLPDRIFADGSRIKEVLVNLVGNASKFTSQGQITLSFQSQNADQICFRVEDTGCGIEADELGQIFSPFCQANNQGGAYKGSGLGLAIAKKNVQLMGGDLRVESQVNQGSQFYFAILCKPVESEGPEHSSQLRPVAQESSQSHTILIVDDHQANRELLYQILAPYPFQLSEASNGQEALECIARAQPDLLLLDLAMPILDGEATIKLLRQKPETQDLPILVLSAMAFEENRASALGAGANLFISKPFQKESLVKAIFSLLKLDYQEKQPAVTVADLPAANDGELVLPEQSWLHEFELIVHDLDPTAIESKLLELKETHPVFCSKVAKWVADFSFSDLQSWLESL